VIWLGPGPAHAPNHAVSRIALPYAVGDAGIGAVGTWVCWVPRTWPARRWPHMYLRHLAMDMI
jgi:hypothetical protein